MSSSPDTTSTAAKRTSPPVTAEDADFQEPAAAPFKVARVESDGSLEPINGDNYVIRGYHDDYLDDSSDEGVEEDIHHFVHYPCTRDMKEADFTIDRFKKAAILRLPFAEVYTQKEWKNLVSSADSRIFNYILVDDMFTKVSIKEHLWLLYVAMMFVICTNFGESQPLSVALTMLTTDSKLSIISPKLEPYISVNPFFVKFMRSQAIYRKIYFIEPIIELMDAEDGRLRADKLSTDILDILKVLLFPHSLLLLLIDYEFL
jgi:succinate dehydrogenase flavin-adding protein (antitoxin of CptAB toxin-antitoxin module)